jgi:hypothetical protein
MNPPKKLLVDTQPGKGPMSPEPEKKEPEKKEPVKKEPAKKP